MTLKPGIHYTKSGNMAKVVRLIAEKGHWKWDGAIWDEPHHIWVLVQWNVDGKSDLSPMLDIIEPKESAQCQ